MTGLYLRCRARIAWTRIKPGSRKDWGYRILIGVLVLIYSPIAVVMFWGLSVVAHKVAETSGLETLERLLHLPAAGFGVLLLFLVLNRVHPVLFEAVDAELLGSLPVTAAQLTRARLTGLAVLMSPLLLVFVPVTVFYGNEAAAAAPYYAVAVLLVALFGLTLLGVGALLTSLLVMAVPARGLRGLSKYGTLAVLFPGGMALFMLLPQIAQVSGVMEQALEYADYVAVGPVAWLVAGLARTAAGDAAGVAIPLAALAASVAVTWGACLALAPRLAARDLVESAPPTIGTASGVGWWAPGFLAPPSRALWRRELTAIRAEAARTILLPLGMIAFFAVMSRISTTFMAMPLIIGLMAMSLLPGLTMASVGQEGRAFWIVRSLPVPMWQVLAVKLAARTSVGVLALFLLVATGYLLASIGTADTPGSPLAALPIDVSPALIPWAVAMCVVGLILSSMWGLATGARFPRFIPPRRGQYVGVGASFLGSLTPVAIFGTLLCSLLPLQVDALRPVLWFLPLAVLAFWVGASVLFLAWGAWHLENLEDLQE